MKKLIAMILALILPFAVLAFDFAKPSEPSGKVVLSDYSEAKQLYQVKLVEVNGENVPVRAHAVWLKPGQYELTLSAHIGDKAKSNLSIKDRRGMSDRENKLNLTVEAGKTYYLAYDARPEKHDDWKPIVYKVD
ncbi:hypothetical protein GCM10011365_05860 [Marinicella pacifica]|jgi:hypothetical protein|uniref:DUF2846 domain-containing protein n=1 Tax=Marinicella pacifica TaxID=1171543 RepID=A0A917CJE3_9GAMM|nr:hypothetical protein [Marinicella pacifica]GGF87607.1 hypothetical protein GCM10011365_05860 [Marinicella pacifica]